MKIWFALLLIATPLLAQTISEKRETLLQETRGLEREVYEELQEVNGELEAARRNLKALHAHAAALLEDGADADEYEALLRHIGEVKKEIEWTEEAWREMATKQSPDDPYALWHQPWTSLEQLIIDYGSADYVYLIPPEVGGIRLSVTSNIPVPRESWNDMLTAILANHGVGIRQLNPFARQLYSLGQEPCSISHVTADLGEVNTLPPEARLCFVLTPDKMGASATAQALERFVNPAKTAIHAVGKQLFIFASARDVREVVKLYQFVANSTPGRGYRLLQLERLPAAEMASLLDLYFYEDEEPAVRSMALNHLPYSLFIWGESDALADAERIVDDIQSQLQDPREMTIYTYQVKHSDTDELKEAIGDVYELLAANESGEAQGNFVAYPKAGTIIMVVEQELLPKLRALIKQLDVPKKMVRIDVLFFEKKIEDVSRFGLDLLRVGSGAKREKDRAGVGYTNHDDGHNRGILQFFVEQMATSHLPAYDVAYNFFLGQEDIRVNANPSVTTLNHVPATIELVEEISIDTGSYVDPDRANALLGRSYSRQTYGITMQITPCVQSSWDEEAGQSVDYISLETDVLFDTPKPAKNDRPPVLRRHIKNEVRVRDGETIILGGLRSKMSQDQSDSPLPFISEIPGLGKLFSSTRMRDNENEMFIFITPHVIDDPVSELERVRCENLQRRQGDTPELVAKLSAARDGQKKGVFEKTLRTLFGRS